MAECMPRPLALRGVHVVDIERKTASAPSTLVVSDGHILTLTAALSDPLPADALVIDAPGTFVIPGLIDAHLHAHARWVRQASLALGVTAYCDPAAWPGHLEPAAPPASEPIGIHAGPPIDLAPGTWPHSVFVTTELEVRHEVQRQAAAGFPFVKLYSALPVSLVRAGIDEAHRLGLRAIGDLAATSWTDAALAGIDFLCHAVPLHAGLLPGASREVYSRDVQQRLAHPYYRWMELVDLDGPEVASMTEALIASRVVVVPTLVAVEAALLASTDTYRAELATTPSRLPRSLQRMHTTPDLSRLPGDFVPRAEAGWQRTLQFIGHLHAAGVPLLAGTDAPRPWVLPGTSLLRELRLLELAGVPSREVLCMSTTDSARHLRIGGVSAMLEAGEIADFLVLDGNPLESLTALYAPRMVVREGCPVPASMSLESTP